MKFKFRDKIYSFSDIPKLLNGSINNNDDYVSTKTQVLKIQKIKFVGGSLDGRIQEFKIDYLLKFVNSHIRTLTEEFVEIYKIKKIYKNGSFFYEYHYKKTVTKPTRDFL